MVACNWYFKAEGLATRGLSGHGCSDGFSFAGVIFFFSSACCSGVSTSFSLAAMASWSSFIFALFCSSLSEVSETTAWRLVLASARMSLTFAFRSEEHTSELQSHSDIVCRLLLEKKKQNTIR